MFTTCPNNDCRGVYRIKAEHLRNAMGTVRCPRCKTVFNALASIRDEQEEFDAQNITRQLPFTQRGDRIILNPSRVAALREASVPGGQPRSAAPARTARDVAGADRTIAPPAASPSPVAGAAAPRPIPRAPDAESARPAVARPAEDGPTRTPPPAPPLSSVVLGMLGDLGLALRNVVRQGRRTMLGLCAIGFGVVALLLAGGFLEWNNWALRESTILSRLGHIQVVKPGYFETGVSDPFAYLLPRASPVLEAIERLDHVEAVAPRLAFTGLIGFGETSVSFSGEGVLPESEEKVSRWVTTVSGSALSSDVPDGIVVGKGLAANLGVGPGDTVVLLATTGDGVMNAVEATVRGLFQTSTKAFDDSALRVHIDLARTLTRVDGAHAWVVLLDDTARTDEVVAVLRQQFPEAQSGLQFVPWLDLADFYKKVVVLFSAQMDLVRGVIAIIILVSISNTLAMSVVERTGEIGTLMAVGIARSRILKLFVQEGALLGVAGGVLGVVLGFGLGALISTIGIPMPPSPGMDFSFIGRITVTWPLALGALVLAICATLIASVYPAWKASRLAIVDALRHST